MFKFLTLPVLAYCSDVSLADDGGLLAIWHIPIEEHDVIADFRSLSAGSRGFCLSVLANGWL